MILLRKAWKIKRNSTEKKESSKQKSTVLWRLRRRRNEKMRRHTLTYFSKMFLWHLKVNCDFHTQCLLSTFQTKNIFFQFTNTWSSLSATRYLVQNQLCLPTGKENLLNYIDFHRKKAFPVFKNIESINYFTGIFCFFWFILQIAKNDNFSDNSIQWPILCQKSFFQQLIPEFFAKFAKLTKSGIFWKMTFFYLVLISIHVAMKTKITLGNLVVAFVAKDRKKPWKYSVYNRYVIGMQ